MTPYAIKMQRRLAGMSLEDLGKLTGVSRYVTKGWENGTHIPSPKILPQPLREESKTMDLTAALQQMINAAVDERIGQVTARGDAMVRMHGEYVKIPTAAKLLNVSVTSIRRMITDGRLQSAGAIGVSVRSIAELSDVGSKKQRNRRAPVEVMKFERIAP